MVVVISLNMNYRDIYIVQIMTKYIDADNWQSFTLTTLLILIYIALGLVLLAKIFSETSYVCGEFSLLQLDQDHPTAAICFSYFYRKIKTQNS